MFLYEPSKFGGEDKLKKKPPRRIIKIFLCLDIVYQSSFPSREKELRRVVIIRRRKVALRRAVKKLNTEKLALKSFSLIKIYRKDFRSPRCCSRLKRYFHETS